MKKNEIALNVEERLRAALHLKVAENQDKKLTVSELCRLAGVSRATLYQHHPELLSEIRSKLEVQTKVPAVTSKSELKLKANSASLELHIKSLLYLCLELQMEVRSLKAIVPRSRKR